MAKKHTGKRSEERDEIAAEVDEALLSAPAEEFAGTMMEQAEPGGESRASAHISEPAGAEIGREPLGENEPAETAGSALLSERAEAEESERAAEEPQAAGAESGRPGLGAAIEDLIQQGVYSGFYGLSYGIVFGALLVGRLVPSDSAMAKGVRDGAEAARHALEGGLRSETSGDDMMAGAT
jgi:hypothetical protein